VAGSAVHGLIPACGGRAEGDGRRSSVEFYNRTRAIDRRLHKGYTG
jgi:hypothetical protein